MAINDPVYEEKYAVVDIILLLNLFEGYGRITICQKETNKRDITKVLKAL